MIKLPKMVVNEDNTIATAVSLALGGAAAACILSVTAVIMAALTGWMIAWCFPATFTVFMAKIGLAEYALWQLTAVVTFVALCTRPFTK